MEKVLPIIFSSIEIFSATFLQELESEVLYS
jgi:hypothetical protein